MSGENASGPKGHKNLYVALAAAQSEMGPALKDSTNPAFRSKYADLASVMSACMPSLSKHGIAVLQPAYDDETGRYIKTIFVHGESGESVECRVPLIVAKNDMQGYGSACTYARRYGLMGMAGIAPEDDDGNAAVRVPHKEDPSSSVETSPTNIAISSLSTAESLDQLSAIWAGLPNSVRAIKSVIEAKDIRKAALQNVGISEDEIPY